ncbi:MAG: T9SS C-terminal target domain-containing protein [Cryomorphaceae bacterium]|nr:MAG: T9SS C-terminal target domain-containing protein [Cryomorphaceae bacterium]
MKKSIIVLLWAMFPLIDAFAQCSVNRYITSPFESERTIEDLDYHSALALSGLCLSESSTSFSDYDLDVYEPVGDALSARPCIVFAHGGSFLAGNKRTNPVPDYCQQMAQRGFVVFSINYRKCFNPLSTNSGVRAVYRAVQDMKAAIRFVKANANSFGVDTAMVFAGGNSAGAIMALHAAYLDDSERAADLPATYMNPDLGCLNCVGSNQLFFGKPKAVINLWGALADTAWIAGSNNFPVVSFHGTADNVVYFDTNHPFDFPLFPELMGSGPVHQRLENAGIEQLLFTLKGQGHEPWNEQPYMDLIVEESARFLYDQFLKPPTPQPVWDTLVCLGNHTTVWFDSGSAEGANYCLELPAVTVAGYGPGSVSLNFNEPGIYEMLIWSRNQWNALSDTATVTFHVVAPPEEFEIVQSGDSLMAPSQFASYQWLLDGFPVPEANQEFWIAESSGSYQVWVEDSAGCNVTSLPMDVVITGIHQGISTLKVYPNPFTGILFLEGAEAEEVKLLLYDVEGREVLARNGFLPMHLDAGMLPAGIYFLRVETRHGLEVRRLVKTAGN